MLEWCGHPSPKWDFSSKEGFTAKIRERRDKVRKEWEGLVKLFFLFFLKQFCRMENTTSEYLTGKQACENEWMRLTEISCISCTDKNCKGLNWIISSRECWHIEVLCNTLLLDIYAEENGGLLVQVWMCS